MNLRLLWVIPARPAAGCRRACQPAAATQLGGGCCCSSHRRPALHLPHVFTSGLFSTSCVSPRCGRWPGCSSHHLHCETVAAAHLTECSVPCVASYYGEIWRKEVRQSRLVNTSFAWRLQRSQNSSTRATFQASITPGAGARLRPGAS